MKIAVLSDIHGNLPALQTVIEDIEQWSPDVVVVNGDIVNRGPNNLACWEIIQEKERLAGWIVLRGNHEDYVLKSANPLASQEGPEAEIRRFSDWTYSKIKHHALALASLPDRWHWAAPDGSNMLVTHASYQSNRLGIYPDSTDDEVRERFSPLPTLFITSHTHRALTRTLDKSKIINIGSSGLPFDGDWRVSYGRFTWTAAKGWSTELRRLEYDRAQALQNLFSSGFIAEAGPFAQLVLIELQIARGLIHGWHHRYHDAFFQGEISMQAAVDQYLEENDLTKYREMPKV
ncbi:MAG: metallophosphoesterase [Ardenticatenaceae bacterium]|nr:metallophosphoesterase [Ardenticatenaceae bacterium]